MNYPEKVKLNPTLLVIILIGTTLLAIPSSYGTFLLLMSINDSSLVMKDWEASQLLAISLTGFGLYLGYIVTAFSGRHNFWFWALSALYNLALAVYLGGAFLIDSDFRQTPISQQTFYSLLFIGYLFFVTWVSVFYAMGARRLTRLEKSLR